MDRDDHYDAFGNYTGRYFTEAERERSERALSDEMREHYAFIDRFNRTMDETNAYFRRVDEMREEHQRRTETERRENEGRADAEKSHEAPAETDNNQQTGGSLPWNENDEIETGRSPQYIRILNDQKRVRVEDELTIQQSSRSSSAAMEGVENESRGFVSSRPRPTLKAVLPTARMTRPDVPAPEPSTSANATMPGKGLAPLTAAEKRKRPGLAIPQPAYELPMGSRRSTRLTSQNLVPAGSQTKPALRDGFTIEFETRSGVYEPITIESAIPSGKYAQVMAHWHAWDPKVRAWKNGKKASAACAACSAIAHKTTQCYANLRYACSACETRRSPCLSFVVVDGVAKVVLLPLEGRSSAGRFDYFDGPK